MRWLPEQSARSKVNRRALSRATRSRLERAEDERIAANADRLEALAEELADPRLELDPACARLLTDPDESPLLNAALPAEDVRSRLVQIRAGFHRRRSAAR